MATVRPTSDRREVGNERRGVLRLTCAVCGVNSDRWTDPKFAQFYINENTSTSPSAEAVGLATFLTVVNIRPDRSDYRASCSLDAGPFKEFIGMKNHPPRFTFTDDQSRMFQTQLRKPFRILATVFLPYSENYEKESIIWNQPGYQNYIRALRECDLMSFSELSAALKSRSTVIFREAPVEATAAGLAAVEELEARKAESFTRQSSVVRRPPPVTSAARVSSYASNASTWRPSPPPAPPPSPPIGPTPVVFRKKGIERSEPNPLHTHDLKETEIKALQTFYDRELAHAMIFGEQSFAGLFSANLGIDSGCSVVIIDGRVTSAKVVAKDYPKIEAWIEHRCPSR